MAHGTRVTKEKVTLADFAFATRSSTKSKRHRTKKKPKVAMKQRQLSRKSDFLLFSAHKESGSRSACQSDPVSTVTGC